MYPRLYLARNLLRDNGVIFISIDDNEVSNLRKLCDEIFGEENLIGCFLWKRRQNADNRNENNVSVDHEYICLYGKTLQTSLSGKSIDITKYKNPDNDARGPWASIDLSGLATRNQRPNLHYDIIDPTTGWIFPPNPNRGWSKSKDVVSQMISEKRILFPKVREGRPREKKFLKDLRSETTGFSTWLDSNDVGFTTAGTREVTELFGDKYFDFPKPSSLLQVIVQQGEPLTSSSTSSPALPLPPMRFSTSINKTAATASLSWYSFPNHAPKTAKPSKQGTKLSPTSAKSESAG